MKKHTVLTLVFATFALLTSKAQSMKLSTTLPVEGTIVKASDPNIQYMGRVRMEDDKAMFNFPGVTILSNFEGTSIKMLCRPKTGYFMVTIDDSKPFKVGFNAQRDSLVTLAVALPQGKHTVRAMYCMEGLFTHPEFKGFVLDEGARLLPPPAIPDRKIEFIGNSITCGYGAESVEKTDLFEDETENHYLTYANIVSDSLHAWHTSISRSGIGAYRNYDGPKEGSSDNMPWQYEYTLFNDHSEKWDFSKYRPQLVCINLGTNDLSTPNYDVKLFEKSYRSFLTLVRSKYPDAKIVLLTGSMLEDKEANIQKDVLNRICRDFNKKGDKQIYRFDMSHQMGDLGYGASWHPSKAQHQKMAGELLPYLRKLMNW